MKELIKKWWFWIIILIIIITISFTGIMCMAFNVIKGEVADLAKEIQNIYPDATLYSSAGRNTLVLELLNYDNERDATKQEEIINIIKSKKGNGELEEFTKIITLTFINSGGKSNALLSKTKINLKEFTIESQESYILYKEYEELFNKYSNAMEGYTNLFNSIY